MGCIRHGVKFIVIAAVLAFALCAAASAGALVTVVMKDGEKIEAELRALSEDGLILHNPQTKTNRQVRIEDVRSIDFGEKNREVTGEKPAVDLSRSMTLEEVRKQAEDHRFPLLMMAFQTSVTRHGPGRVEEMAWEIEKELERKDLAPASRRDLQLARSLALRALGETQKAREQFLKVRSENPGDPVVLGFEEGLKHWRERANEKRGATTTTEKPRNEGT